MKGHCRSELLLGVVRQQSGLFEVMVPVLCNLVTLMCDGAGVIFFEAFTHTTPMWFYIRFDIWSN